MGGSFTPFKEPPSYLLTQKGLINSADKVEYGSTRFGDFSRAIVLLRELTRTKAPAALRASEHLNPEDKETRTALKKLADRSEWESSPRENRKSSKDHDLQYVVRADGSNKLRLFNGSTAKAEDNYILRRKCHLRHFASKYQTQANSTRRETGIG
jgi:hypothetical protein